MSPPRTNNNKYPANKWAGDKIQTYPIAVLDQLIGNNETEIAVLEYNLAMHKKRIEDLKQAKQERMLSLKRQFDTIAKEYQASKDDVLEAQPITKKRIIVDGRILLI